MITAVAIVVLFVVLRAAQQHMVAEIEQDRREQTIQSVVDGDTDVTVSDGKLLAMLADHPQCANSILSIYFFMADMSDPEFARLDEFPNLREIGFYDCDYADSVMPVASKLPKLESLFFEVTLLSDDSLKRLTEFKRLEEVHFEQVMDDETIAMLNDILPDVNVEAPFPASQEPIH